MNKVSLIMDDGAFSTKILDDESLDASIEMFRTIMSTQYEIKFQNGQIMAIEADGAFVLALEWDEAMV